MQMLYRDYIQLKQYFFAFLHLSIISSSKCYVARQGATKGTF